MVTPENACKLLVQTGQTPVLTYRYWCIWKFIRKLRYDINEVVKDIESGKSSDGRLRSCGLVRGVHPQLVVALLQGLANIVLHANVMEPSLAYHGLR